ncbi:Ig-like domain-containing protein [candidate division KSB1 bacterium]|nr:Ig-like domain-containing protein [candidate division KSB1 bacterium]
MKSIKITVLILHCCLITHIGIAQEFVVQNTIPVAGAINVPDTSTIRVFFNKKVDPVSVSAASFQVMNQAAVTYDGSYTITDSIIHFDPDLDFLLGDTITVNLTADITSTNTTELTPYSWTFAIKPQFKVIRIEPDSLTQNVSLNQSIYITCNDTIVDSTVTAAHFIVTNKHDVPIAGTITVNDTDIVFQPDTLFAYDDSISVILTSDIINDDDTPLTPFTSWFRTRSAFHVVEVHPENGSTNVAPGSHILVMLSDAVDPLVTTDEFIVQTSEHVPVPGTIHYENNALTMNYDPTDDFPPGAEIHVELTSAIKAADGTPLIPFQWNFKINQPPDTPKLLSPATDTILTIHQPEFEWNVPVDVDDDTLHFRFELATHDDFTDALIFESRDAAYSHLFTPPPPFTSGQGICRFQFPEALEDSTYYWRVTAMDNASFGEPSQPFQFKIDTSAPMITSLEFPSPDFSTNWFSNTNKPFVQLLVYFSEQNPDRLIINSPLFASGPDTIPIDSNNGNMVSAAIPIGSQPDGIYPVGLTLIDKVGLSDSASDTLKLDSTAPVTLARSPAISISDSFTVNWSNSTDLGSGIANIFSVKIKIDDGSWNEWLTETLNTQSIFVGSHGHIYSFEAIAWDNVGNREQFTGTPECSTTVDNFATDSIPPPPPINLVANGTNPSPWQNQPGFTITWENPDDPSGINRCFYKLDDAPTENNDTTATVPAIPAMLGITATQENHQMLYVWLEDGKGNSDYRNTASVNLRYDATAPTGTIAHSIPVSQLETFTVSWTSGSDGNGSGLSGTYDVRMKINNGDWTDWQSSVDFTSASFTGVHGNLYSFEAAAWDVAGNLEVFNGVAECSTYVDTTKFNIVDFYPADQATNISPDDSIWVKFNRQVDENSIHAGTFLVANQDGHSITGATNVSTDSLSVTFIPTEAFATGDSITVTLTDEITDISGTMLTPFQWRFSIVPYKPAAGAPLIEHVINYPNPFSPGATTTIKYKISDDATVSINIYNLAGEHILELMNDDKTVSYSPSGHEVMWDGTNFMHQTLANGIYICEVVAVGVNSGQEERKYRKIAIYGGRMPAR